MKGLLIKDWKLMKAQRSFLLLIAVIGVWLTVFSENPTFGIGYMSLIGAILSLSSISYDEFDNGSAFLFTLPITRRGYVREKFVFCLLMGGGMWLAATALGLLGQAVRGGSMGQVLQSALVTLPALLVVVAVMLPIQLRFGGEKGRIVVFAVVGLVVIVSLVWERISEAASLNAGAALAALGALGPGTLLLAAAVLIAAALAASYGASLAIMRKKQF